MKAWDIIFFSLFIAGLALWAMALRHALFLRWTIMRFFYLLIGGQLVKLGYSYGSVQDEELWRDSVSKAFKSLKEKK